MMVVSSLCLLLFSLTSIEYYPTKELPHIRPLSFNHTYRLLSIMNGILIGDAVTGGLLYGLPLEPSFGLAGLSGGGGGGGKGDGITSSAIASSDNKSASKEAASSLCAAVFAHLLKVQESIGVGGPVPEDLHVEKHYPDTLRALYSNYLQFNKKKKKGVTIVTPTNKGNHASSFPAVASHQVEFDGDSSSSALEEDGGMSVKARRIMQCEHNRCLVPTYTFHGADGGALTLHIHADPFVPIFVVAVTNTTSSPGSQSGSNSSAPSPTAFTRSDAGDLTAPPGTFQSGGVESFEQRVARGALQVFLKEYGHNYMAAVVNGCIKGGNNTAQIIEDTAKFSQPANFSADLSKLLKDHLPLPMTSVSVKALKKLILPEIKNLYKRCIVGEFGASVTRAMASVSVGCQDKVFVRLHLSAPSKPPSSKPATMPIPESKASSGHLSQDQVNRLCPLSSISLAFLSSVAEEQRLKRPLPIPSTVSSPKQQDKESDLLDSLLPKMSGMFNLYSDRSCSTTHMDGVCCATLSNTTAQKLSNKRWMYVECRRAIESLVCLYGKSDAATAVESLLPRFRQRTHASFIYRCEQCADAEKKVVKKLNKEIKKRQQSGATNRNARQPLPLANSSALPLRDSFATPATCFNVCVQCEPVDSKKLTHPVFLARSVIVIRLEGSLLTILRLNWLIETRVSSQQQKTLTPIQEKIRAKLGLLTNAPLPSGMLSQAEASQMAHAAAERAAHHFLTNEAPMWLQGLKMLVSNNISIEM